MRFSPRKKRKSSRSDLAYVVALAACFALAACGGPQRVEAPPAAAPNVGASVTLSELGAFQLVEPPAALQHAQWIGFFPAEWPDAAKRPLLGLGTADEASAVRLLALREVAGIDVLRAEPIDAPRPLGGSKLVARVEAIEDRFARLSLEPLQGVAAGDLYFAIDARSPEGRFGERVIGLLRIVESEPGRVVAEIEHARRALVEGDLAVFAQAQLDLTGETATILVAPFDDAEGASGGVLPAIVDAVPGYLAEYGLSNIGVASFDHFIDPTTPQAPRHANEAAESRAGYGTLVFGQRRDAELVLNTTTWGTSPHPANTVGILPGGLPLPIRDGVAGLSAQLAPSFIATVLAQRGDHATAIYFLESILRDVPLDTEVRYHLREHLALRYNSIGRFDEAMALMTSDVAEATAAALPLQVLNALSIRAYLADENGFVDTLVADTRSFLEQARGALPAESLGHERLHHARALAMAERVEESRALAQSVLDDAAAWQDEDLATSAQIELAMSFAPDDTAAALLVLSELSEADAVDRESRLIVDLLTAELLILDEDPRGAESRVVRALAAVEEGDSAPLRASVYRRAARVLSALGRTGESATATQEAARLYLETAQLETAAATLFQLAMTQLELLDRRAGAEAALLVQEARTNLFLSAELSLHLGFDSSAGRAFVFAALLEQQLGQQRMADQLFDRAYLLAQSSANYRLLHDVQALRAEVDQQRGDTQSATLRYQDALRWAEVGGFPSDAEPVVAPTL